MASQLAQELIDAGIHFGHRASRWNPKMKPYIHSKHNNIHIIDIKETIRGILFARKFLAQVVASGKEVLFVGTKRQARKAVETHAHRVGMHWVTDRWLGGTLTNFREIRKRIGRLEELEQIDSDGLMDASSKKQGSTLRREMRKIKRNLEGIRRLKQLPGAIVLIDQTREIIAVREARKMHVPIICLLDTDCDPDLVDIAIPGNDDAMRGIELIMSQLADSIAEGVGLRAKQQADQTAAADDAQRRRSRRPTTARAVKDAESDAAAAEKPGDAAPADAPEATDAQ